MDLSPFISQDFNFLLQTITYSGCLFPHTIPFLTGYIGFGYFMLGMVGQVRLGMVGLRTHRYSSRLYAIINIQLSYSNGSLWHCLQRLREA